MGQEILITGATGFIGSYVTKDLLAKGYNVTAISRKKHIDNVKVIHADVANMDVEKIAYEVGNCDAVIHLASCNEIHNVEDTLLTNVYGSYNMIQLANKVKAKKFIFLSSVPIIGVPKDLPIKETHHERPVTEYHVSKWCAEKLIAESGNMDVLIYRIPSPIGIGMSSSNYMSCLLRNLKENKTIEVFGSGLRIQNYIDVRDVSRTITNSISIDVNGMYLLAGESISNIDLANVCREMVGSTSKILVGERPDPEEENKWIISVEQAKKDIGFFTQYSLWDTIKWIFEGL